MPYVNLVTNVSVPTAQKQALVEIIGPAVELIPGKSRDKLFIRVEGDASLYFAGKTDTPCAMVSIDLFGQSENPDLAAYADAVCVALATVLEIQRANVYLNFTECRHWGSAGGTSTAF